MAKFLATFVTSQARFRSNSWKNHSGARTETIQNRIS